MATLVSEESDRFVIAYPAQVHYHIDPVEGGKQFTIQVSTHAIVPFQYGVSPRYTLFKTAIRGMHYNRTPKLVELHAAFIKIAATGVYDLNPFIPGPSVDMQAGNGAPDMPSATVATVEPTPTKPLETKPAELKAVPPPPSAPVPSPTAS